MIQFQFQEIWDANKNRPKHSNDFLCSTVRLDIVKNKVWIIWHEAEKNIKSKFEISVAGRNRSRNSHWELSNWYHSPSHRSIVSNLKFELSLSIFLRMINNNKQHISLAFFHVHLPSRRSKPILPKWLKSSLWNVRRGDDATCKKWNHNNVHLVVKQIGVASIYFHFKNIYSRFSRLSLRLSHSFVLIVSKTRNNAN